MRKVIAKGLLSFRRLQVVVFGILLGYFQVKYNEKKSSEEDLSEVLEADDSFAIELVEEYMESAKIYSAKFASELNMKPVYRAYLNGGIVAAIRLLTADPEKENQAKNIDLAMKVMQERQK